MRVGMGRRLHDVGNASLFDPAPRIHDKHAFGHLRDRTHVMGYQNNGCLQLRSQIAKKGENLCLHGHVQRRCRLVGDQDLRLAGKRDGNHHTLPLATGKLMRVVIHPCRRIRDPHRLEKFDSPYTRRRAVEPAMKLQHLGDLPPDGEKRVQRGHRLLEDHRDLVAADLPHPRFADRREILALEPDGAAAHLPHRRQQSHHGQRRHRLAAS